MKRFEKKKMLSAVLAASMAIDVYKRQVLIGVL